MRAISFLMTVALLTGASSVFAQSYYNPPQSAYVPPAGYYAADAAELESRISKLEADIKKKQDAVDTKKKFSADWSGRVFMDSVNFGDPHLKNGVRPNDTTPRHGDYLGFRDVRIGVAGKGFEIFDYKAEFALERNNHVTFTDVFFGAKNIPGLDTVRVGHYKVETGMSQLTSGRNITAMERPTPVSVFGPSRRFGAGQTFYFANDSIRWFNGVFAARSLGSDTKSYNDGDMDTAGTGGSGAIFNSRFTMVPVYKKDGERFLHFGWHTMYMDNPNRGATFLGAPNSPSIGGFSRSGNNWLVNGIRVPATPLYDVPHYTQGGVEMAWGRGPLAVTSEFFAGTFDKGRDMYGGYVEVRYFLTGDTRPYDKKNGAMGNVKIKKNFLTVEECINTFCHGAANGYGVKSWGAWEVFAQWSFTDSDRIAFRGGEGGRTTDTVLGLNWYWNPNTRMMFEYVHSDGTRQQLGAVQGFRATEDIVATSLRFYF
jgi:phosphate-selective porin OprO/OprP